MNRSQEHHAILKKKNPPSKGGLYTMIPFI